MPSASGHSFAFGYLKGENSVQGFRFAYRSASKELSFSSEQIQFGYYSELGVMLWQSGSVDDYPTNAVLSLSPVFTCFVNDSKTLQWEFGIGLSLVNDTRFAGKNIGSHYQFEDRVGLTFIFSETETVSFLYMHYSNGGLNSHNPGVDFLSLSYIYAF